MRETDRNDGNPLTVFTGFAVLALSTMGIAWAIIALIAINRSGDYGFIGGGLFAIASALSFGMLLNSLVRS